MRETEMMNKDGMRDHATVDKLDMRGTERMERGGVEGGATSSSTNDAVNTAIPKTTEAPEQNH